VRASIEGWDKARALTRLTEEAQRYASHSCCLQFAFATLL
jgi:hypothetical protein